MRGACTFAPMIEEDLDEIISIERNIFIHPWSKDFFRRCGLAAPGGAVPGLAGASPHRGGRR